MSKTQLLAKAKSVLKGKEVELTTQQLLENCWHLGNDPEYGTALSTLKHFLKDQEINIKYPWKVVIDALHEVEAIRDQLIAS